MTTEALLPCPFCGDKPERINVDHVTEAVCCRGGSCPAHPQIWAAGKSVERWNTRALSRPLGEWKEAIEAAAKVADGYATCGCNGKHGACMVDDPANAIAAEIRKLVPPGSEQEGGGEADWVAAAAMLTLDAADAPPAIRDENGHGVEHASWMLHEIVNGRITGRKAHRWLGYAQGLMVAGNFLTLDEAKKANKRASDEYAALKDRDGAGV